MVNPQTNSSPSPACGHSKCAHTCLCRLLERCAPHPSRACLPGSPRKLQVRHEAVERRLLVAEAACALAPCLPHAQAAATVLRLLEALLHDSQPQVGMAWQGILLAL